jgi:hypothetical protein
MSDTPAVLNAGASIEITVPLTFQAIRELSSEI